MAKDINKRVKYGKSIKRGLPEWMSKWIKPKKMKKYK